MGFFDRVRKAFSSGSERPAEEYWIYVQCRRCGEPLRARVDLRNEPSQSDEGDHWIVRKGLVGSGGRRCFQTVEVILTFDQNKQQVIDSEVTGGKLITADEYKMLLQQAAETPEEEE